MNAIRTKTIKIKNQTYHFIKKLGTGAYAKVYQVKDQNGKLFAIKKFKYDRTQGVTHDVVRELDILSRFYMCPNIITIHGFKWTKTELFILLEHGDMNLKQYIKTTSYNQRLEWFPTIAWQLLLSIAFLHKFNIAHRDLKPENILVKIVDGRPYLLLCDFGIAKKMRLPHNTPKVTTLWYRAPENLLKLTDYDKSIDIWGVGCILYEYLYDQILFRGKDRQDMLRRIFSMIPEQNIGETIDYFYVKSVDITSYLGGDDNGSYNTNNIMNKNNMYNEFIFSMTTIDPKKRYSAKELLDTHIFNDFKSQNYVHNKNYNKTVYPKNNITFEDYLSWQNSDIINKYYRQTIVNCMLNIGRELMFDNNTIFLTVDLIDRYLGIYKLKHENELRYITFACLTIACKYFEINVVDLGTLANKSSFIFGNKYKESSFASRLYFYEENILSALNFNIFRSNIFTKTKNYNVSKTVMCDYNLRRINLEDVTEVLYYMQKIGQSNIEKLKSKLFKN